MVISIKRLESQDGVSYRQLRLEALKNYPESFGSSYEEESQADMSKFVQHIGSEAASKFMLGAFDGSALIGMCGFLQGDRNKTRHRGNVTPMYVEPAHAGQQIGRRLLAEAIKKAFAIPEIEQLELEVVVGNAAAEKLYEQAGFQTDAVMKRQLKVAGQYYDFRHMLLIRSISH